MIVPEAYSLAQRAGCKLAAEASRPNGKLRIIVGHANFLDSLVVGLHEEERFSEELAAAATEAELPMDSVTIGEMELDDDSEGWDCDKTWTTCDDEYTNYEEYVAEERDEDESEDSDEEELVDSDEEDSDDGDTDEDEYIPSRKFTLQPRQSSLERQWHASLSRWAAKARSAIHVLPIRRGKGDNRPIIVRA